MGAETSVLIMAYRYVVRTDDRTYCTVTLYSTCNVLLFTSYVVLMNDNYEYCMFGTYKSILVLTKVVLTSS